MPREANTDWLHRFTVPPHHASDRAAPLVVGFVGVGQVPTTTVSAVQSTSPYGRLIATVFVGNGGNHDTSAGELVLQFRDEDKVEVVGHQEVGGVIVSATVHA